MITGHARRDSQRRGTTLEHVAHSGKWPTVARSIPTDRRASGYGELSRDRARVDPGAKIFTRPRLSASHSARITAAGMNHGATVTGGEGG